MNKLDTIKELISKGEIQQAIAELDDYVGQDDVEQKDLAYYLRGNAYRKQSNWQQALNNYQQAIDINPESPAVEARKMMIEILDFYYKDMYNQ